MADEKQNGEQVPEEESGLSSDSGLGNLPPLSDFDSTSGASDSDSGLPAMGSFDSGTDDLATPADGSQPSDGGLDFASGSGLDTPTSSPGFGFQDLAADSDFSPETPDVGPGPSSDANVDTPMFDSAFGGTPTPQATQAMETPMFGGSESPSPAGGFDAGAFGAGADQGGAGTPPPDFSPDTGMQPTTLTPPPAQAAAPAGKSGGGMGKAIVALVIGLVIGLLIFPFVSSYLPFLPTPNAAELETANQQITKLKADLAKLQGSGVQEMSPAERDKLREEVVQAQEELNTLNGKIDVANGDFEEAETMLAAVKADLETTKDELLDVSGKLEEVTNQVAIQQAQQAGLEVEVARLNNYVGSLEKANQRRIDTKASLQHNVEKLVIQIKDGMQLTPEKYNYAERLAAATNLRDEVAAANWITPTLQDTYAKLYLKELEIAASQEYFFAKIPVTDTVGNTVEKWSECLMRGNWSVIYRTVDGVNAGSYMNMGSANAPQWTVNENYSEAAQAAIAGEIAAARVPDYASKIAAITNTEMSVEQKTKLQKIFESL